MDSLETGTIEHIISYVAETSCQECICGFWKIISTFKFSFLAFAMRAEIRSTNVFNLKCFFYCTKCDME